MNHLATQDGTRLKAKREDILSVCRMCPERPYVQLQVPENAYSIHQVKFTIISHDQGWADSQHPDPYCDSYTWFGVLLKKKALRFNVVAHQLDVQRNVRGSGDFRTHQVSWDTDGANGLWVRSIEKGDVIELVVRAEYQAWVNIVKSVELEIVYEPETEVNKTTNKYITNSFGYIPLESSRHIRLILVHPGSFDDPLNCTLIHSSLESAEISGFEAMSYCWGDSTMETTINMEYNEKESELGLSGPVGNILRHMRRNDGQIRKLWIDAVCIDQSNYQERAQQVALMADVYSMADVVNVWLGPSDHITQLALRVIRDIHNYQKKSCPGGNNCCCLGTAHTMTQEDFQILDEKFSGLHQKMDAVTQFHLHREPGEIQEPLRYIMRSHYTLISELYKNPWFTRVWVLQEVVNSKRAILQCGVDSILWKELIEVDECRYLYVPHLEPLYRLPQIWIRFGTLRNPSLFPSVKTLENFQEPGILDALLEALELNATDPRDKIFALLSFGRETHNMRHLPELIRPDYTKSVDRVFTDFTRWWINEHKSLQILSMIHGNLGRTWQDIHCPSVKPPTITKPTWILKTEGMYSWTIATLDSQFEFRASGDSVPHTDVVSSASNSKPSHLRLLGYKVAQIEELSHFPLQAADNASLFEVYQKIFEPVMISPRLKSLRKQGEDSHSPQKMRQLISEHLQAHWRYGSKEPLSLLKTNPVRKEDETGYKRIESNAVFPCHGPCFFVASDGSIGLCPPGAREKDWIAILLGGKVPFLLREVSTDEKEEPHFEFIGECYVDGKMYGEFVQDQKSKGLDAGCLVLV